jgi:hypothetical protein
VQSQSLFSRGAFPQSIRVGARAGDHERSSQPPASCRYFFSMLAA